MSRWRCPLTFKCQPEWALGFRRPEFRKRWAGKPAHPHEVDNTVWMNFPRNGQSHKEKTPKRPRTKRPRNQEQQGEQSVNRIKRKPRRSCTELEREFMETHITKGVRQTASGNLLHNSGNSNQALGQLRWGGVGDVREIPEGGDICMPVADSC